MIKRLLLVEDNPSDEKLTLRALRKSAIEVEVIVARDGVEALDYLFGTGAYLGRPIEELPTVVLLDLKLPRIDGLEVLRRIRAGAHTRLIPVVVLTSSALDADALDSYRLGANAYVRKPVDFEAFVETAKTLGLFWLSINDAPPQPPRSPTP